MAGAAVRGQGDGGGRGPEGDRDGYAADVVESFLEPGLRTIGGQWSGVPCRWARREVVAPLEPDGRRQSATPMATPTAAITSKTRSLFTRPTVPAPHGRPPLPVSPASECRRADVAARARAALTRGGVPASINMCNSSRSCC